jgi:hypothetical protein
MIPVFIAVGCLWLYTLIRYIIRYIITFNKFISYLFSIDDKETLRKIGGMNALEQRTFANVPFTKVHKILQEKYKITKNESYYHFDKQYLQLLKRIAFFTVLLFMLYVVYHIVPYGFSD